MLEHRGILDYRGGFSTQLWSICYLGNVPKQVRSNLEFGSKFIICTFLKLVLLVVLKPDRQGYTV